MSFHELLISCKNKNSNQNPCLKFLISLIYYIYCHVLERHCTTAHLSNSKISKPNTTDNTHLLSVDQMNWLLVFRVSCDLPG